MQMTVTTVSASTATRQRAQLPVNSPLIADASTAKPLSDIQRMHSTAQHSTAQLSTVQPEDRRTSQLQRQQPIFVRPRLQTLVIHAPVASHCDLNCGFLHSKPSKCDEWLNEHFLTIRDGNESARRDVDI